MAVERGAAGRIWTIGHSTRELADLVRLLQVHGIQRLADVRSFPASRRHPHFSRAQLEISLPAAGIAYRWMPELGGMRRPDPDSTLNAAGRPQVGQFIRVGGGSFRDTFVRDE